MIAINVAQLLQDTPGATRTAEFSDEIEDPTDDLHLAGPVRGRARLTYTGRSVLADVRYQTVATLECSRCLDPVSVRLGGEFAEEFLAQTNLRTGVPTRDLEKREEPDGESLRIDERNTVTLDEPLRQDILTSLPLRPLCDTSCPGLCPRCGKRQDARHAPHPRGAEELVSLAPAASDGETYQPFAQLAELLQRKQREDAAGD